MIGSEFGSQRRVPWRLIGWGGAAALLLLPYAANAPWTASDYVVMGAMLAVAGATIELAVQSSTDWAHRLGGIVAVTTGFLTVWVNLAVGMIGSEDNPYNLWFGGVLAIAITGALIAPSSASMARTMTLAAVAQTIASAVGFAADARGGIFSLAFAGLWLISASLFWMASRNQPISAS